MSKQSNPKSRRQFLLNAGLGSAGAAAAIVVGKKAASGVAGSSDPQGTRGYHVSEHIKKYYKTTLV